MIKPKYDFQDVDGGGVFDRSNRKWIHPRELCSIMNFMHKELVFLRGIEEKYLEGEGDFIYAHSGEPKRSYFYSVPVHADDIRYMQKNNLELRHLVELHESIEGNTND